MAFFAIPIPVEFSDLDNSEDEGYKCYESCDTSSVAVEDIDLEENLTCTICQSTYTDPHILSCLHSFCKSCLSKHISTTKVRGAHGSNTIMCPLCRSEHSLSAKGVDDLMPNTQLARKVENLLENFEMVRHQCDQCEAADVISFCSDCENFLCSLCDQSHKRMAMFKSHELMLPKQAKKKSKPKSFQCATHPTESLEVYCITCKRIVCRDCALYAHNCHTFKRAVEASDEIRESLVSDSEELMANLCAFRSHAEAVAKVEKHVTMYPDNLKAFITAQFEELQRILEKRKETLLKEVDTQYNGFSKTLWVEKDFVETSICKLEAGIKFAQQLAKSKDKLEVAVLGSRAVTSMRQMMKTLSWDPKTIENLGPVGYAAQGSDEYLEFIEEIGKLNNMEISINDKGYKGHRSSHYFTKNGTYCVEVEVSFGNDVKPLFPQMSISCTCKTEEGSVSCTTEQQQQGKWEVTFQTADPGSYTIIVTLKISGKDYSETIRLHVVEIYDSPMKTAVSYEVEAEALPTAVTSDSEEEGVFAVAAVSYEEEFELPATVTSDSEEEGVFAVAAVSYEEEVELPATVTSDSEEEVRFAVAAVTSGEEEVELPATVTSDSEEVRFTVAAVSCEEVAAIQLHVEPASLPTTKPALNVISRYDAEAFPSSSSNSRRSYTSVYDSTELRPSKPRTDHPCNSNYVPLAQRRLPLGSSGHNSFNRHLKQENYQFRSTSHSYVRPSKKGYK